MKKIVLILLIAFMGSQYAQEYTFDRMIQYEENDQNMVQMFFNTKNPNYQLYLHDKTEGAFADLYDRETKKIHHFSVAPFQEGNSAVYSYLYQDSDDLFSESSLPNGLNYEFKTKRDDNYYQFADLEIFYSDNEPFVTAELVMRYSEENLFNAFNTCCLLGYELGNTIDTAHDFVVVKATIKEKNGKEIRYQLIDDQVVQFKLHVKNVKKKK